MKDRLSPKNAPPITIATMRFIFTPVVCAKPIAIGVRATIVPTLVPIDKLIKQVEINNPARIILSGNTDSMKFTVASTHPISFAVLANAPANMNIHIINIMFSVLAPLLNTRIRSFRFPWRDEMIAYIPEMRNAVLIGTL